MAKKRIGVFGGIFDPVHKGHQAIVETALNRLSLDKIYIVPSAAPPHKPMPVLDTPARIKLLKAVFDRTDGVEVSDIEMARSGPSYTFETIDFFKQKTGAQLFFIMGADNIGEIKTWKHPEKILTRATVVVVERPGFDFLDKYPEYRDTMVSMKMDPSDIHSRQIRASLLQGRLVDAQVPAEALALIKQHNWYC